MANPFMLLNRRTIRAQTNPMDKCTIVSIFPREIDTVKETIQPGRFIIPAGSYVNPAILVVGPSSWWRELDEEQPLIEIPTSSPSIAKSVIEDYFNGVLGYEGNAKPGVFWIPGEFKVVEILSKHRPMLDKANAEQKNWYANLVRIGDELWAQTNGNPSAIPDTMRLAAKELGLDTKEWLQDFQAQTVVRCVACGSMRNPQFPICPSCHNIVDQELYNKLGIKATKVS